MTGIPVAVVGDAVLDRYVYGLTTRVSREAPVPVILSERMEAKPGGAANAALNASTLGARTVLLGVVGKDEASRALLQALQGWPVQAELVRQAGRATAQKTRVLAGGVGTRQQQVLRLDDEPRGPPSARAAAELNRRIRRVVKTKGVRALLFSDYGQGLLDTAVLSLVMDLAREGLPVVVDSRYGLHKVSGPVVLKPNAPELAELVGAPVTSGSECEAAAREALRRTGARAVVATRGRDGMVVVPAGGATTRLAAHGRGEVTDVTGAGDTVAAALTVGLAAGLALEDAARLANVAASVVVQKLGAATASPAEVRAAWREGAAG